MRLIGLFVALLLAAPAFGAVDLDAVQAGELLRRGPDGLTPLPVLDLDVRIEVTGIMVHGTVRQRFRNDTPDVIEALYVFPLPERAAVHAMELRIGERRIVSTIREREQARQVYEQARTTGRKAALVEQQRPNLFTSAAANINPGETIDVELQYFEESVPVAGVYRLAFPLAYTPRCLDGATAAVDSAPRLPTGTMTRPSARIEVRLRPGFELSELRSASHRIEVQLEGAVRVIRPEGGSVVADRDFLLSWVPRRGDAAQASVFIEERDGERYALIMVLPPTTDSEAGQGLPTETLFVVDVSGSMDGPSIRQAREALLAALDRLRPEDRFNILRFNDDSALFRDDFAQAGPAELEQARAWVRDLRAGGGTMIYPALMRAVALAGASRSANAQRIVFLTDGAVGNEQEILRALHERLGEIRLHAIGIGQAPNRYLMRKLAARGRGLCEFIASTAEAENRIAAFFARLERPVLEDVQLDWEGVEPLELYPSKIPDLYTDEPLLISTRLRGSAATGSVRLAGYGRQGLLERDTSLQTEGASSGVAVRWARAKVDALMDELLEGADPEQVRSEVIDLALAHDLVTRFTSLVAVEEFPTAEGDGPTLRLAAALPQGGTDGPLKRRLALTLLALGITAVFALRTRTA